MLSAETIVAVSNTTTVPKCPEEKPSQFTSREDLLSSLGNSVDEFDQFFLVVRRGSSFQRQLKIWQRESKRSSPERSCGFTLQGKMALTLVLWHKNF